MLRPDAPLKHHRLNETGNQTYVIFEENGQPIKEKGAMILICNNDIKTGVRHVYWLKSIEVYRVK